MRRRFLFGLCGALVLAGAACLATPARSEGSAAPPATTAEKPKPKTLPGFQGVPWGAPKQKVLAILGKRFNHHSSEKHLLVFTGGEMGGYKVEMLWVICGDEGFTKATVAFGDIPERRVIEEFEQLKKTLTGKYGEPSDSFRDFKSPYFEGDGCETQALRLGKATFKTYWTFPTASGHNDRIGLSIGINLLEQLDVVLSYENGARIKKREAEKAKDF